LTSIKSLALVIPGKSSLERLKVLRAEQFPAPILMISGLGSVAMAVSAIKHGAVDFIEKPLYALDIVARVQHAIETYGRRKDAGEAGPRAGAVSGGQLLSRREREVVAQLVSGGSTRKLPGHLGSARERWKTTGPVSWGSSVQEFRRPYPRRHERSRALSWWFSARRLRRRAHKDQPCRAGGRPLI
jgi:FixJ family two-component response regulator